ncbi:TPA: acyltransferase family protein [Citrobacter freundii]
MLKSIQSLRGVAAWLVVIHHIHQIMLPSGIGYKNFDSTIIAFSSGVDLFFVISGFIIYNSIMASKSSAFIFLAKRLWRVVPLYWFYTFAAVILTVLWPGIILQPNVETGEVLKSFLFIPYINKEFGVHLPFLTVGWTLNYEMYFYVISFFALLISRKYYFFIISFLIPSISVIIIWIGKDNSFYADGVVNEFLIGVFVGWVYRSGIIKSINSKLCAILILVSIAFIFDSDIYHDYISVGIPCGIIVLCFSLSENGLKNSKVIKYLSILGDWSYSTYLSHVLVICLIMKAHQEFNLNLIICIIFSVVITAIVSFYTFNTIESRKMPSIRNESQST